MKTGYYYRSATEHLSVRGTRFIASCGSVPAHGLLPATPEADSVKPNLFYHLIKEQSPGPYLELFARRPRAGWSQWGNQIESTFNFEKAT